MEGKSILFIVIAVLIIIQAVSFVTLSVQYNSLERKIERTERELTEYFLEVLDEYGYGIFLRGLG